MRTNNNLKFSNDPRIPSQPYPELRDVLGLFAHKIQAELVENLIGIYLVGSVASGDFDADSDIDFLVVTKTDLTEANVQPLEEIQSNIHAMDCYPARHLEGSFISIGDLNDFSTVGKKNLYYFDNGSTVIEPSTHDNQWHVRWILRERGIPLMGPTPSTLFPPVPPEALANEMRSSMREIMQYFSDAINQPLNFFNSRFGQSFTVLTYCRMLHTLHTGMVQSKKAGVTWAKEFVDPRWAGFVSQAWDERKGVRFGEKIYQRAEMSALAETQAFIDYAIEVADQIEG